MKRSVLVALSIILLCSLSALPTTLVKAYYAGYETTNYQATDAIVMDGAWSAGTWTYGGEWDDAAIPPNLPDNMHWRDKWTYPTPDIIEHYLIEFFADNTTDTGDYFEMCVDCHANGGSTPQTDDIKIYYSGQDNGTLIVYQGDGSGGWVEHPNYTIPDHVQVVNTISASPSNSTPHLIIELTYDRLKFDVVGQGSDYSPWIRVAVYDANSSTLAAWPPTDPDVPDDWGLETGTMDTIPEALTVVAVILLSSVAVVVSFYFLRKRPKTESYNLRKT